MSKQLFISIAHSLLVLLLCFAALATASGICQAQQILADPDIAPDEPWELLAQELKVDQQLQIVEARDQVELRHQEHLLQADYARYYWDTGWVYLRGNVYAELDEDYLWAEEAEFDLQSREGWLKEAKIFMPEPHMYISGQHLEKTGAETYEFEEAEITTCKGEPAPWSLITSRGNVTLEGYAHLHQPRFRVKDRSVLYAPYLVMPAKLTRQSGFLRPQYHTSTRDGTGFNLPYFQVINAEQDLTFYLNYMSNRGFKPGLEYRFNTDPLTKGMFRVDWLQDRVRYDSEPGIDPDDYHQDRFWLRGKMDGYLLSPEWRTILDLDFVSDEYYLREFDRGYSGFGQSREDFRQELGRDIANRDAQLRQNMFVLSRSWADIGLQGRLDYFQNPEYRRRDKDTQEDPTLQKLPELHLDFYRGQLGETPLQWEARNVATHFWRRKDDLEQGLRLDMHPRMLWPLRSDYGTLLPSAGWRQTLYHLYDKPQDMQDNYHHRGIWDVNVNAFSEMIRIFDLQDASRKESELQKPGQSAWTRIRHSLQPELDYDYIPEKDQANLPEFDGLDRIEPENSITYSLTNILTRRQDSLRRISEDEHTLHRDYLDFLDFKLEQSYDFREADREKDLDQYPRRPFSDIRARLLFKPYPWLSFRESTWISPYTGNINEHEHMLRLTSEDTGEAYFGLDYRKELEDDIHRKDQNALRILRTGGKLHLGSWTMQYDLDRDLEDGEIIEQRIGVGYSHQCWDFEVNFLQSQDENRVEFMLSLYQLGDIDQPIFTEPR